MKSFLSIKKVTIVFLLSIAALSMSAQSPNVLYVKVGGTGGGTSWADAAGNIQQMISFAPSAFPYTPNVPYEIWVAGGEYYENLVFSSSFPTEIYGGFDGTETELNQRDWRKNVTTIDGGWAGQTVRILDDSCRVDGFTITKGYDMMWGWGAGIVVDRCPGSSCFPYIYNTVLKNLIVWNNYGIYGGGIRLQYTVNTLVQNVEVYDNIAHEGAGIWIAGCDSTTLVNVLIYRNEANYANNPLSRGGGMYIESSIATLINTTISDNTATYLGCGITLDASTVTIYNSILGDNTISTDPRNSLPSYMTLTNSMVVYRAKGWLYDDFYHLLPSSPCIDGGLTYIVDPYTQIDLEGNIRVCGASVDMGVYEYGSWLADPSIRNQKSFGEKDADDPVSVLESRDPSFSLSIYPNPTSKEEQTSITLGNNAGYYENPVELTLYAIDGRVVYYKNYYHGNIQTDFSNLSAGVYVLKLQTQEGNDYRHKLFISK